MPQIGANPTSKTQMKERKRSNSVNVPFKRPLVEVKDKPQMDQKINVPNLDRKYKSQTSKGPEPKSLVALVPGSKIK